MVPASDVMKGRMPAGIAPHTPRLPSITSVNLSFNMAVHASGRVPDKVLPDRSSTCRLVRCDHAAGSVPDNVLLCRLNQYSQPPRCDQASGRVPEKAFPDR